MLSLKQQDLNKSAKVDTPCDNEQIKSKDEMRHFISRLCRGDLYVVGKLWIDALKFALVGSKFTFIPVVEAVKQPDVPQRPPPMKYKELPIYSSPHNEYKEYIENKEKCPETKIKLIHRYLFPYVKCGRKEVCKNICEVKCQVKKGSKQLCTNIGKTKNDIKKYMRDPENLRIRQAVVAGSAATGYLIGRSGGIPRKFFYTSLGGLLAGALCFPKEADETFRTAMYHTGKVFVTLYNIACKKGYVYKERIPCREDLPTLPPKKPQCTEK